MPTAFGEYAREDVAFSNIPEGEHPARIIKAELPRDPQTGGFLQGQNDKTICDVTFEVLDENSAKVKRRYSISFGQNNANGQWAAFAELIAAATGIKCGDKKQRQMSHIDVEGQEVRVILKNQERNGKTYLNIINVLPPKFAQHSNARPPQAEPPADKEPPLDFTDIESTHGLEDEIPF